MDTEFFNSLDKFTLTVRKRVSTAYTGTRRSVRFGHGISPVGYREYRKGDDFKLVDWKVYGRTEKLFIREHEEERSLIVHVLLDSSGSMKYGRKFEYASQIAAGFAYLATQENEKFSISLFDQELHPSESRRGMGYLLKAVDMLDSTNPTGKTNIKRTSDQFDRLIRSTSLVVMVSDFLDDIKDIESSIYRLSGHDLILVQVLAPEEIEFNLSGDFKFVDLETEKPLVTRITKQVRDEYQDKIKAHNSRLASICNSVRADYFLFQTDKPIFDAFFEISQRSGSYWRS